MNTPWGKSEYKTEICKGITVYSTASHGGFKVINEILPVMPKQYINGDGWYEEDCESCKVVLAFPHLFEERQRDHAKKTWEFWFKDDGTYKERA